MASLFDEDLRSSDSEDDDYVPDGEVTSDEDLIEDDPLVDEIETKQKSKKKVLDTECEKKKADEGLSSETKVDKEKANDLFRSFLKEVEAEMKMKEPNSKSSPKGSNSTFDSPKSDESSSPENKELEKPSCELFEFAGETISVESSIANSISEFKNFKGPNKNVSDKPTSEPPVTKRKGLQSVLTTLMNKKPKLTVLDKTSLDWLQYKKEHGISEELENFNKGRGGFIERQRFLERSDLRSYEIEHNLRMSKSKRN